MPLICRAHKMRHGRAWTPDNLQRLCTLRRHWRTRACFHAGEPDTPKSSLQWRTRRRRRGHGPRARRLRSSWPQACQGSLFIAGWRPSNTRFDVGDISGPFVVPWWAMWIHTQASQLCLRWRMGCVVVSILIHGCGYNARPTQAPALRRDKRGALVLFFCDTHERSVPVREHSETDTSAAKHRSPHHHRQLAARHGKSTQAIPATCAKSRGNECLSPTQHQHEQRKKGHNSPFSLRHGPLSVAPVNSLRRAVPLQTAAPATAGLGNRGLRLDILSGTCTTQLIETCADCDGQGCASFHAQLGKAMQ